MNNQQTPANTQRNQHLSATSLPSRTASAPLPSPSTAARPQYFPSLTTSSSMASTASSSSSSAQNSASSDPPPQYTQYHATTGQTDQQQGYSYAPERSNAGATAQETRNYIDQFALVAEAAKRAQMAVLMRDMEGVELS